MNTFLGTIDEKGRIKPDYAEQMHPYLLRRFGAGCCIEFEVREQGTKRTDRQNKALHALIGAWAKERGHDPDQLKEDVKGIVFGHVEVTQPITGKTVQVLAQPHSSRLNVADFCHLMEETLRLAAEDGVWLEGPDEYRKAKKKSEQQAAKRAAKEAA